MRQGEWVTDKNGRVGVVSALDSGRVYIRWIKTKAGTPIELAMGWYYPTQVKKAPLEVNKDDAYALIDLALATKDIEWAQELYNWYILD